MVTFFQASSQESIAELIRDGIEPGVGKGFVIDDQTRMVWSVACVSWKQGANIHPAFLSVGGLTFQKYSVKFHKFINPDEIIVMVGCRKMVGVSCAGLAGNSGYWITG